MMTSRERINTIFAGGKPDRCGFWLGNPHTDTWPLYFNHFGIETDEPTPVSDAGNVVSQANLGWRAEEQLRRMLGDDFRWICPQWTSYKHPDNKPIWEHQHNAHDGLASAGVFAQCEDAREVEDFPWPNPDYLDFTQTIQALKGAGDVYRASGMWSCFFHDVADFFGMENYFVKMYSDPEVVEAVTRKICEFYLEANERFFALAKDEVDGVFFGNDFGTQLDLLVSPRLFDRFIMPWFTKFTEQGHRHGYQVILHSCGAIHKVIDRLIDAKVDALHPLQAKAADMDAASLARDFQGRIAFMGGIDTQHLLVYGTPDEVRDDVRRIKSLLGPNLVVSPSHEALLPNVPPENVLAMAEAVAEL
ncbi:MAG: uroporphyrinogen decarboxylase family protein [Capsulimonadaceae bacterium]|nr:uroporphyrinogen decarboxylase family protein [Capsulimonadaceae bacterium]